MRNIFIKDTEQSVGVLYKAHKGHEYPDLSFIGGEYLYFLIKKSENFVRALYVVTNFIKDTEPIKWRLRTLATDMISELMSFIKEDKNRASEYLYRARFLGGLSALISLLNIAMESGVVSEANSAVLKREISSFFPIFGDKIFHLVSPAGIADTFKEFPAFSPKKESRKRPRAIRKMSFTAFDAQVQGSLSHEDFSKGQGKNIKDTKNIFDKKTREIKVRERFQRQKAITDTLKDKKKLTAKELMSFMKDYSEKTIQRELSYLVEKGVLQKIGEKRWSSYVFVQPVLGV